MIAALVLSLLSVQAFQPAHGSEGPSFKEALQSLQSRTVLGLQQYDLASGSKATVVVFLSAKCPCSASHEERLKALYQEFAPQGIEFVGIHSNADEDFEFSQAHFKKAALPFPVIQDELTRGGAKLADLLGALKTPHAYVLRGDEIVFQGGVDDSKVASAATKHFLRDALSSVVKGQAPEIKIARALGCMIKRN